MSGSGQGGSKVKLAAGVLGLALAYLGTAALAHLLATPADYRPAVWLPAGLSVVAVLLGGYALAAGVALGAFVTSVTVVAGVAHGLGAGGLALVGAGMAFGAAL